MLFHQFRLILNSCNNNVMYDVDYWIKHDVYLQKLHSCSQTICGSSKTANEIANIDNDRALYILHTYSSFFFLNVYSLLIVIKMLKIYECVILTETDLFVSFDDVTTTSCRMLTT